METKKIETSAWKSYFDQMTGQMQGKRALVEVASLDLGDQIEAEWIPLLGITYDPEDHALDVILQGIDHRVRDPREISVVWKDGGVEAIEIVDDENRQQIIRLRKPLSLPRESGFAP